MANLTTAGLDRVRAAAQAAVDEFHMPGISVGVVSGDDLVFQEGFGFADIESKKPQDPALRQRIGSITKTMVALCAMAVVQEGKLSLDDRLIDHLPQISFHGPAEAVTLRHLLTHTAGIGEAPLPSQVRNIDQTLWSDEPFTTPITEAYPGGITIEAGPGTKWAYANHGFMLLGEIVARAEGRPIEEVLRRRVFEPLGMDDTDCLDAPHPDLTTGYHRAPTQDAIDLAKQSGAELPEAEGEPVDGYNYRGHYQYVRGRAAGAVQSTIPDMARYASALLRGGAGIVLRETFDRMVAPQWSPDDRLINIGLAFFRQRRFGHETFGHGGVGGGGWNTHLCVLPDEGLALLTHANIAFEKFTEVDGRILRALLDAPAPPAIDIAAGREVVAKVPGVYQATMPGPLTNFRIITGTGRVQISERDGGLMLHARRGPWKDGVRMRPADDADPAFFRLDLPDATEPPRVALIRDSSGAVTGLRFDRLVEMERANDDLAWAQ